MKHIFSFLFVAAALLLNYNGHSQSSVQEYIYTDSSIRSCHASTIVECGNELLVAWFGGEYEGHKEVNIYLSRFKNGTWSKPEVIADGWINDSTRYACYNPVLFYTPQKELLLFYKIGPYVQGWTGWMKRSKDGGRTWSKPEALPEGILGPIRNQPILVHNQLICPSSTEKGGWMVHFEFTSNWGKTWSKGPDLNNATPITGIQPAVLIHKNGLQALCRSQNGTLNETWSYDKGKTWTPLKQTEMINNNSGIAAITLKDGRHLLVYNNVKPDPSSKEGIGPRSPLNLAISNDGKKWIPISTLENEVGAEFSYPYIIQSTDGKVHISYTWKRKRIKYVVFTLQDLANLTKAQ
ncbi:MAG: exo-alpha-sialidase [Chitinophagaceae bacterium]|nr:exo-alpha-sialidase [Chitinophagaceae bacterium]